MTRPKKGLLALVVLLGITAFVLPIACEHFTVADASDVFEPAEQKADSATQYLSNDQ